MASKLIREDKLATATPDRTLIERTRARAGLTRPQFERLVAVPLYTAADLPAEALPAVRAVGAAHSRFIAMLKRNVSAEFRHPAYMIDGVPHVITIQVARALGLGEFHIANMRARNKLHAGSYGRKAVFTKEDVIAFIDRPLTANERSSPLAGSFIRFVEGERLSAKAKAKAAV